MATLLEYAPYVLLGVILVFIAYQVVTKGLKGATFGGKIVRTYGEIDLQPMGTLRGKLRIHEIAGDPESSIGIEVVHKSLLSYDMTPIRLHREDVTRLIELLGKALEAA
jgi:hypothetical protein